MRVITVAVIITALAISSPALAQFGLGWATDAANHELALTACTKRLHPGLTGEKFEEAKKKVDLDWAMARALSGSEVDCAAVYAMRRRMPRSAP